MIRRPAVVSWSGGKDSALALQAVRHEERLEILGLLCTVTTEYGRISMHGVRTALLHAQCEALGLPLFPVQMPRACSNAVYDAALHERLAELQVAGINDVVFGDIFLRDVREYRERRLNELRLTSHFPLWLRNTAVLAEQFVTQGFRAVIVCTDAKQLDSDYCGREFDRDLLAELPSSCDPCGERGEFHTFVYDGPIFRHPVRFVRGEIVKREGFVFCDLVEPDQPLTAS